MKYVLRDGCSRSFKVIVHPKMKILLLITLPHAVPNP